MRARALIGGENAIAVLVAGPASAQHGQPCGTPAPRASEPYNIEAFGVFCGLILRGDFAPKVAIGSVMSRLRRPASVRFRARAVKSPSRTKSSSSAMGSRTRFPPRMPRPLRSWPPARSRSGRSCAWTSMSLPRLWKRPRAIGKGPRRRSRQGLSFPVARDRRALRHACQCRADRRPSWHGPANGDHAPEKRRQHRRRRRRFPCVDRPRRHRHPWRRAHSCALGIS